MGMETGILVFIALISAVCFLLFAGLILLFILTQPYPNLDFADESEKYFYNPEKCYDEKFPSLNSKSSVTLSVIVPAYREEKRLSRMLDEALPYLEARCSRKLFSFEIIIVDDGSDDNTADIALSYSKKYGCSKVRLLKLIENRGKGGAVRRGMLAARGSTLLFADADGATCFSDIEKLEAELSSVKNTRSVVVCGSRAHLQQDAVVKRSALRNILMYAFHMLVWICCVQNIKDTQCGFKLFTRDAALVLFSNLHVERWAFDCDLLYLANQFKMQIREVPVTWTEIEGSKIIPIFSWAQMGIDIILIRLRYMLGVWKIESRHRLE